MRLIVIASLISLAAGVAISTGVHTLAGGGEIATHDRTKETLRLLRRGYKLADLCKSTDKVKCIN